MPDHQTLPDGWELVERRGNYGWLGTIMTLLNGSAFDPTTITWKVRERSTGEVHAVTASTDREAMRKIAERQFDGA